MMWWFVLVLTSVGVGVLVYLHLWRRFGAEFWGGAWCSAGRFFHTSLCDDFFQGNDRFLQFHDFHIHKVNHLFHRIKLNFTFRRIQSDFTKGWGQVIIGIQLFQGQYQRLLIRTLCNVFQLNDSSFHIPRPLTCLFFFYLSTFLLLRIETKHTSNSLIT